MSKAYGQYLGIQFTEKIISDCSAILGTAFRRIVGATITASNLFSSSYPVANLTDENLTSQTILSPTFPQTLTFKLAASSIAQGMKFYNGGTAAMNFSVEGSTDGVTYTALGTFTSTSAAGWQEFLFSNQTSYLYYRLTITSGGYIYFNEMQFKDSPLYLKDAFSITGQQYTYEPEGTLTAGDYQLETVSAYPNNDKAILLAFKPLKRFHNVEGNLTITYDSAKGNLAGYAGPVSSFSQSFLPADLIKKPNPNDAEHIEIKSITASGSLLRVYYTDTKSEEHIELSSFAGTGTLTHVNDL